MAGGCCPPLQSQPWLDLTATTLDLTTATTGYTKHWWHKAAISRRPYNSFAVNVNSRDVCDRPICVFWRIGSLSLDQLVAKFSEQFMRDFARRRFDQAEKTDVDRQQRSTWPHAYVDVLNCEIWASSFLTFSPHGTCGAALRLSRNVGFQIFLSTGADCPPAGAEEVEAELPGATTQPWDQHGRRPLLLLITIIILARSSS